MSKPSVREVSEAWEAVFRSQVSIMRELRKLPEFKVLSMGEYDVLFNLSRCPSGSSRLGDLNEHLLISQPSLSRMAERLELKGLVTREPDPEDQRAVLVTLTDAGRETQKRIGREHVQDMHRLLGDAMTAAQFKELTKLAGMLSAALSEGK